MKRLMVRQQFYDALSRHPEWRDEYRHAFRTYRNPDEPIEEPEILTETDQAMITEAVRLTAAYVQAHQEKR